VSTLTASPSLFERLGGAAPIAAVVDDFYTRILADATLAHLFAHIDLAALRGHQARFIGYALGGPNRYRGRNIREAHAGLAITPAQFAAVAGHLSEALAACGVAGPVIEEVIGHVAGLRDEVVGQ
jgi:hemoglobin